MTYTRFAGVSFRIFLLCSITILLVVGLFFFYPLSGGSQSFTVETQGELVKIDYVDNKSLNVNYLDTDVVAYLSSYSENSSVDYVVKVATEDKSFLQVASSCEHEFTHLDLRDREMTEKEDHNYMKGRVSDVADIRPMCYRFTVEALM